MTITLPYLRSALDLVDRAGAAYVPGALPATTLSALGAEVAERISFAPMPGREGRAFQEGEVCGFHAPFDRYPVIDDVGRALTRSIHADGSGIGGCGAWVPNEVYVQRYSAGDLGITPHLDLKRYRYLVAIFTVSGQAPFLLCRNRAGDVEQSWSTAPGSLVLLRAPGLGGVDDGRPLHAVRGPESGRRISLSYRMDTSA